MSNLANPPSVTRSGRLIIQYVADLMLDASDSDSDAEIPVSEDEPKLDSMKHIWFPNGLTRTHRKSVQSEN